MTWEWSKGEGDKSENTRTEAQVHVRLSRKTPALLLSGDFGMHPDLLLVCPTGTVPPPVSRPEVPRTHIFLLPL